MNHDKDPNGPLDPRDRELRGEHGLRGEHDLHGEHHDRHPATGGYPDDGAVAVRPKGGFGLGLVALVLGVLALLLSWVPALGAVAAVVLGLLAIVLGFRARSRAKQVNGSGRGLGVAGAVLGLLSLIIAGLVTFGIVQLFGNSNIDECLKDAGTDQSKIEKCSQDFSDEVTNNGSGK